MPFVFVVSLWWLLLLSYHRLATNTLPSERDFQTLLHRLHAQNLSKALLGFSLPHNLLMSWLTSTPFCSPLLYFPGKKPHTLVPGRQPLSFEHHLQWRIDKMTQNWLFSVMSQEILHPNCGCMNISTIDLCCLSCFSLPPQLGCGAEGKDTCLGRCLSGKEIQLFLFAGSPGLYV